jgi:2-oxoglutarate ferredoxin oxidoreductase subunit alpha
LGIGKLGDPGPGIEAHFQAVAPKQEAIAASVARAESGFLDGAEFVVTAFGTAAKFVRYVVRELRREGVPIGYVRPITLWPFPYDAVAAAADGVRAVFVFEINNGQMIDDVRLGVLGRAPVQFIGGISSDGSGFGVGSLLDVDVIRARVETAITQFSQGALA